MIKITSDQVDSLFEAAKENLFLRKNEWIDIDKGNLDIKKWFEETEDIEEEGENDLTLTLLDQLNGYKLSFRYEGSHRTDGQMVDYFLVFKNKEDEKTEIQTEMCLMMGFDHGEAEVIK